jgi:hypothetical protein
MEHTIQFKIRLAGDTRNWEQIPVIHQTSLDYNDSNFQAKLRYILNVLQWANYGQVQETRWNWEGVGQGHYVS